VAGTSATLTVTATALSGSDHHLYTAAAGAAVIDPANTVSENG